VSNYQSFELKDGHVMDLVEGMCRHLTTGGQFTDSSTVKRADVENFINVAYYWLVGQMSRWGYSTTVTADAVKAALENVQAIDAAVQVEFAVPVTSSGEENNRYRGLVARRDSIAQSLLQTDALEVMGAVRSKKMSTNLEGTGRSIDRKQTVYSDTDVVPARFPRGFGQRNDVSGVSGRDTPTGADTSQT